MLVMPRRKFTIEEKEKILDEARHAGIMATVKKYNLAYSVFLRWRKKKNDNPVYYSRNDFENLNNRVKMLIEENQRLKKIIAEQALELQIRSEKIDSGKNQGYA